MEHENAGPNANIRQRMEERKGCKWMRGRRKEGQRRGGRIGKEQEQKGGGGKGEKRNREKEDKKKE